MSCSTSRSSLIRPTVEDALVGDALISSIPFHGITVTVEEGVPVNIQVF